MSNPLDPGRGTQRTASQLAVHQVRKYYPHLSRFPEAVEEIVQEMYALGYTDSTRADLSYNIASRAGYAVSQEHGFIKAGGKWYMRTLTPRITVGGNEVPLVETVAASNNPLGEVASRLRDCVDFEDCLQALLAEGVQAEVAEVAVRRLLAGRAATTATPGTVNLGSTMRASTYNSPVYRFIRENWAAMSTKQIAEAVGLSTTAVRFAAKKMSLPPKPRVNQAHSEQLLQQRRQRRASVIETPGPVVEAGVGEQAVSWGWSYYELDDANPLALVA